MVKKATINESRILAEMAVRMWDGNTLKNWQVIVN